MGWDTGILIDGGELQGEVLPYVTDPFTVINRNDYAIIQSEGGSAGQENDINSISIDAPYTVGASIGWTQLAYFAIRDENGNLLRYICIRYKFSSSIGMGGDQVQGEIEIGWMDPGYNYTPLGGRGFGGASGDSSGLYPFKLKLHVCISKLSDSIGDYIAFGAVMSVYIINRNTYSYAGTIFSNAVFQGIYPEEVDYSPEFGNASEPDGYGQGGVIGSHDKHSDHVGIPSKPQYGFTSAGFLNHYRISSQGLSMLGSALFPEPIGQSSSIEEAIDKLIANSWNSKIIDYVIDCRIIPVTAPASQQKNITCGGKMLVNPDTQGGYTAYLVDEDFVDIDCGVISTPLTEGNFIDFITKAKVFIPFYGFVELEPEYWHGAKIGLYYRFNLMDGSFMAWLTSAPFRSELRNAGDMEIIGQYAGNACIHLPINSQSYSQIISGMITTGAAIIGAAAGGAIGGAAGGKIAAGAVNTAISGAANIAAGRPQLINNNSYNGSASLMSCREPYLLIEFTESQFSKKYVDENGLPSIITCTLGSMTGFTSCVNPIINFVCEEEEAAEIRALLQNGVIL